MSLPVRLFPTPPARSAFGVNNAVQNAGDYILNKTSKRSFCNISLCKPANNVDTQSDLLKLRKSNYLYNRCSSNTIHDLKFFNKSNLNVNLFTKMDLTGVKVIGNSQRGDTPTSINIADACPPYIVYTIDPCGVLFGNTTCGINNYQNFIVYNPPYVSINSNENIPNNSDIFNCGDFIV
jgi:hypothetical protein